MIQQWDCPVDEPVSLPEWRRYRVRERTGEIAERIQHGVSIRSLAGEYGVNCELIRCEVARAGIEFTKVPAAPPTPVRRTRMHRLPGRGRSRAFTPDEVAELLARHHYGESIRSLARATGVSHETIRQTLARAARDDAHSATV